MPGNPDKSLRVSGAGLSFLTSFKVSLWVGIHREEKIDPLSGCNSASIQHGAGSGATDHDAGEKNPLCHILAWISRGCV